jgi:hypothetical protein
MSSNGGRYNCTWLVQSLEGCDDLGSNLVDLANNMVKTYDITTGLGMPSAAAGNLILMVYVGYRMQKRKNSIFSVVESLGPLAPEQKPPEESGSHVTPGKTACGNCLNPLKLFLHLFWFFWEPVPEIQEARVMRLILSSLQVPVSRGLVLQQLSSCGCATSGPLQTTSRE